MAKKKAKAKGKKRSAAKAKRATAKKSVARKKKPSPSCKEGEQGKGSEEGEEGRSEEGGSEEGGSEEGRTERKTPADEGSRSDARLAGKESDRATEARGAGCTAARAVAGSHAEQRLRSRIATFLTSTDPFA